MKRFALCVVVVAMWITMLVPIAAALVALWSAARTFAREFTGEITESWGVSFSYLFPKTASRREARRVQEIAWARSSQTQIGGGR